MVRFGAVSIACLCILTSACDGDDGPTAPSPSSSFNGQWNGTTSHGRPISLTVAADRVTTVTVGYNFAGCSGTVTATNVNAEIVDLRNTPSTPPPDPYFFTALLGPYSESDNTQITGFFRSPSDGTGNGLLFFVRPGCGESITLWSATKR